MTLCVLLIPIEHESGTHVVWGLNLGRNNITAAFLAAQSLVKAFASPPIRDAGIVLDAIELATNLICSKIMAQERRVMMFRHMSRSEPMIAGVILF